MNCKELIAKKELKSHSLLCATCWTFLPVHGENALHNVYQEGDAQMCTGVNPHDERPCWHIRRQHEALCHSLDRPRFFGEGVATT